MKVTKIKAISISNFKGIANGTFNFNGENAEIIADVMQGKSTIKDAYLFVLGMDIDNFYPVDKNNKPIDDLETRIDLTLDVDGIEYTLSRSAKVKYKIDKERGTKLFDGYKKDMFEFDGVPCNATEYKTKLCNLLGLPNFETLKYLTVLNYFNEQVDWKKRREIIYSLFVDRSEIDDLKSNEKYSLIASELKKGKTSAIIAAMLNSENNALVDKKRKNEILLADKKKELAGFANINYASIETELESVETAITAEQARIDGLDKESKKAEVQSKIKVLYANFQTANAEDFEKSNNIASQIHCLEREVERLKMKGQGCEADINLHTNRYKELKAQQFDEENEFCPSCGFRYPQEAIEQDKKEWQENHDKRLQGIKSRVLELKKEYETIKEEYTNKLAELETAKQELADFKPNPRIAELETEIANLQAELEKCETNEIDTSYLEELKAKRNFLIVELGKKDSHDKLLGRIESLTAEAKDLVNAEILLAKKRRQLEFYTFDVINLVNDSINAHFDGVKFKLFEVMTAAAKKEIRETLICLNNGVEYSACSTGQKANLNCIVVSTLQNAFGVNLPIWLDDASILNLKKEPSNQLIYLLNEKGRKLDCTRIDEIY